MTVPNVDAILNGPVRLSDVARDQAVAWVASVVRDLQPGQTITVQMLSAPPRYKISRVDR